MKSIFSKLHLQQAWSFSLLLGVLLGSPIFTYGQVNLAKNKVAKQSTTNGNYSAANAVDGNPGTISATANSNDSCGALEFYNR